MCVVQKNSNAVTENNDKSSRRVRGNGDGSIFKDKKRNRWIASFHKSLKIPNGSVLVVDRVNNEERLEKIQILRCQLSVPSPTVTPCLKRKQSFHFLKLILN